MPEIKGQSEIEKALSATRYFELNRENEQVVSFPKPEKLKEFEGFRKEVFEYFDVQEKRAS